MLNQEYNRLRTVNNYYPWVWIDSKIRVSCFVLWNWKGNFIFTRSSSWYRLTSPERSACSKVEDPRLHDARYIFVHIFIYCVPFKYLNIILVHIFIIMYLFKYLKKNHSWFLWYLRVVILCAVCYLRNTLFWR